MTPSESKSASIKLFCKKCKLEIKNVERSLLCEGFCTSWYHIKCCQISESDYNKIKDIREFVLWMCSECKLETRQMMKFSRIPLLNNKTNDLLETTNYKKICRNSKEGIYDSSTQDHENITVNLLKLESISDEKSETNGSTTQAAVLESNKTYNNGDIETTETENEDPSEMVEDATSQFPTQYYASEHNNMDIQEYTIAESENNQQELEKENNTDKFVTLELEKPPGTTSTSTKLKTTHKKENENIPPEYCNTIPLNITNDKTSAETHLLSSNEFNQNSLGYNTINESEFCMDTYNNNNIKNSFLDLYGGLSLDSSGNCTDTKANLYDISANQYDASELKQISLDGLIDQKFSSGNNADKRSHTLENYLPIFKRRNSQRIELGLEEQKFQSITSDEDPQGYGTPYYNKNENAINLKIIKEEPVDEYNPDCMSSAASRCSQECNSFSQQSELFAENFSTNITTNDCGNVDNFPNCCLEKYRSYTPPSPVPVLGNEKSNQNDVERNMSITKIYNTYQNLDSFHFFKTSINKYPCFNQQEDSLHAKVDANLEVLSRSDINIYGYLNPKLIKKADVEEKGYDLPTTKEKNLENCLPLKKRKSSSQNGIFFGEDKCKSSKTKKSLEYYGEIIAYPAERCLSILQFLCDNSDNITANISASSGSNIFTDEAILKKEARTFQNELKYCNTQKNNLNSSENRYSDAKEPRSGFHRLGSLINSEQIYHPYQMCSRRIFPNSEISNLDYLSVQNGDFENKQLNNLTMVGQLDSPHLNCLVNDELSCDTQPNTKPTNNTDYFSENANYDSNSNMI